MAVRRWAGLGGHYRARSCRLRRRRRHSSEATADDRNAAFSRPTTSPLFARRAVTFHRKTTIVVPIVRILNRFPHLFTTSGRHTVCVCVCVLAFVFRLYIVSIIVYDSGRVRSRYGQPAAVNCCCCCRARARASNATRANGSYGHTC